ncbi:YcgL domain-containing protein [Tatumella terrea]|uniref:YcgL domain-containing protein ACFP9W_05200 n=1 Tax=Tatumella terrea TaxID=419007 RepID=A0ABW1VUU0_9GAMM|nr:YcgL domain-containing protein [Tatumella sp. JGM118]MBS0908343.1 YcgL domain-containing protein [Tatumella sp. JGM118]
MLCAIYRSSLRDQTYLYIEKKDDFSRVPEELLKGFGKPVLAMVLSLAGREKLGSADIHKVKQELQEKGYYLQVPPPVENLLKTHLASAKN